MNIFLFIFSNLYELFRNFHTFLQCSRYAIRTKFCPKSPARLLVMWNVTMKT